MHRSRNSCAVTSWRGEAVPCLVGVLGAGGAGGNRTPARPSTLPHDARDDQRGDEPDGGHNGGASVSEGRTQACGREDTNQDRAGAAKGHRSGGGQQRA